MNRVTLKNLKYAAFASHETPCFSATIWLDGKRVGTVENDGNGGPCLMHIPYTTDHHALNAAAAELGEDLYRPPHGADGATLTEHLSDVLMELAEDMNADKKLRAMCRKHLLFRIEGDDYSDGAWLSIRAPYTADLASRVRAKYAMAGKSVTILNETLGGQQ